MNDSADIRTKVDRASDRELVVTRMFKGPARIVFRAWAEPALFQRWWTPKSHDIAFVACEMDVRTGGAYRLVFSHPAAEQPMAFFGRYLEVIPNTRIVWTNEEGDGDGAVTTVTFEEVGDMTRVVLRDLYPSKEALDETIASGATCGFEEQFDQLEGLVGELDAA